MESATEMKTVVGAAQSCAAGTSRGIGRRTLYVASAAGLAAGLSLGWEWLVAVGAASVILALAPCLVMCALGICMSRACQKTKTEAAAQPKQTSASGEQRR